MHPLVCFLRALSLACALGVPAGTLCWAADAGKPDAAALVRDAIQRWRGSSSYTEVAMTIHRPDWERHLELQAWTRGADDALVRFTAPAADAGNATLQVGRQLWLFNPKLSQVIALPFSMMAQGWMGSDFSYDDLAKSERLLTDYTHALDATEAADSHTVYTVTCAPRPGTAVVWGALRLRIRDDGVLLEELFLDQSLQPVRRLVTTRVAPLGGRPYPVVMRMEPAAQPGQWTELRYAKGRFDLTLPGYLFTTSNLRNPRPWREP